jgi:hypothetical protein
LCGCLRFYRKKKRKKVKEMANWLKVVLAVIGGLLGIALTALAIVFLIATIRAIASPAALAAPQVIEVTRVVEVEKIVEVEEEVEITRIVIATPKPIELEPTSVPSPALISGDEAHWARLEALDPTFRSGGLEAWLLEAGVSWSSLEVDARQIEEETSPQSHILASGIQVDGKDIVISYPVIVTTDDPSRITVTDNTRQHKPDERNPSVLYTNVVLNGIGTIWIDGSNWGQLTP